MTAIFLSYARDDDESFVRGLYEDLDRANFDVWFDRISMPSRQLTFLQEIGDAIAACDRLLLVIGPKAAESDYVTKEWRWAFAMGKCVNPIVRLDGQRADGSRIDGYTLVPKETKFVHAEDFRIDGHYDAHLHNLIRQLSEPMPPLGKLIAVPDLPGHYREQQDRIDKIREALLLDLQGPEVAIGASAKLGLQGMGGIGKSVLATALARDFRVRLAFPDGIIWVRIGQKPNPVDLQRRVAKELGDTGLFDDPQVGKQRLRDLLEQLRVLLILDDVWKNSDAEALNVIGPRCKLLVTSRDAALVASLAKKGNEYQVQLLTQAESLALLAAAANVEDDSLPPIAGEIVDQCGRLPLALALCGSMTYKGHEWDHILRALREARLELIIDSQELEEHHRSIWRTMEVSVEALEPDEQARFVELAVFEDDAPVVEAAVYTLWAHTGCLDELAAKNLLVELKQRSLVELDHRADGNGTESSTRVFSLHDLLHDFAIRVAARRFGSVGALHQQLLDAYEKKCHDGWPTGPNDGYFFQRLAPHLLKAGRTAELVELLCGFEFIEAKVQADLAYELQEDYERALQALRENQVNIGRKRQRPLIEDFASGEGLDSALDRVARTLRLSLHVVSVAPEMLAGQLLGRLLGDQAPGLSRLLHRARPSTGDVWLRPKTRSLAEPMGKGGLVRTLTGHSTTIVRVALTRDGVTAVSVPRDGDAIVWNVANGSRVFSLRHDSKIWSMTLTPDDKGLVTGLWDGTIKMWDLVHRCELWSRIGDGHHVECVAVSADGETLFTGSAGRLQLWDLATGRPILTLDSPGRHVCAVAVTTDTRLVVAGYGDGMIGVWNLDAQTEFILEGHEMRITDLAITADDLRVVSASFDTVRVWELRHGTACAELRGHTDMVSALALAGDNKVVSASHDHTLRVWDLQTGSAVVLRGHSDIVFAVKSTHHGRKALSASLDRSLRMWDLTTGKQEQVWVDHGGGVEALAVTKDGATAVSGSRDRTLKVWDLSVPGRASMTAHHAFLVKHTLIANDGRRAVTASNDDIISWDMAKCSEHAKIVCSLNAVQVFSVADDARRCIYGSTDYQGGGYVLTMCDLDRGVEIGSVRKQSGGLEDALLLPGRLEAIAASTHLTTVRAPEPRLITDGILTRWNLKQGQERWSVAAHSNTISALVLSPNGQYVVTGSDDKTLKLWNLSDGRLRLTLTGHSAPVNCVAITPDGTTLLSASRDENALRIWNLRAEGESRSYVVPSEPIIRIVVTANGRRAVTLSHDGTATVWDLERRVTLDTLAVDYPRLGGPLAVTPDGRFLVCVAEDGDLWIWDMSSRRRLARFVGDSRIKACAVTPDGRTIIAGDETGRVHFLAREEILNG